MVLVVPVPDGTTNPWRQFVHGTMTTSRSVAVKRRILSAAGGTMGTGNGAQSEARGQQSHPKDREEREEEAEDAWLIRLTLLSLKLALSPLHPPPPHTVGGGRVLYV